MASEIVYKNKDHYVKAFNSLNELRTKRQLCDVVLFAGSPEDRAEADQIRLEIHAHKAVLAATCPFFRNKFTSNQTENEICIKDVPAQTLNALVDYIYSSNITINDVNVLTLLPAANLLQLNEVHQACCDFLKAKLRSTAPATAPKAAEISQPLTTTTTVVACSDDLICFDNPSNDVDVVAAGETLPGVYEFEDVFDRVTKLLEKTDDELSGGGVPIVSNVAAPVPRPKTPVPDELPDQQPSNFSPDDEQLPSPPPVAVADVESRPKVDKIESDDLSDDPANEKQIKRWQLHEIGPDIEIECETSYVESPSLFWCRPRPCVTADIEENLIVELQSMTSAQRILDDQPVQAYCVALFRNTYRRGRLLEFKRNSQGKQFAKILFIDHGNKAWVAADRILALPEKCRHYLWQATLCRLYGVEPTGSPTRWSFDEVQTFRSLCDTKDTPEKDLFCYVLNSETPSDHCYTVKLSHKWDEQKGDEEFEEREEFVVDQLLDLHRTTLKRAEKNPADRFLCSFEESTVCPKDPPEEPESWQVEFHSSILAAQNQEEEFDDGAYVTATVSPIDRRSEHNVRPALPIVRSYDVPNAVYKVDKDDFVLFSVQRIVSPDEFYVKPCDSDATKNKEADEQFNQLIETLTVFYSQVENQIPLDCATVKENPYVAAQMSGEGEDERMFCRCRVKSYSLPNSRDPYYRGGGCGRTYFPSSDIRQELRVELFFIDSGRTEKNKPALEVFLLDKQFCDLPAQVMKCGLFSTRPIDEGVRTTFGNWKEETTEEFKRMCKNDRPMKGKILMEEADRFGLVLFDTDPTTNRPIIINHELLKKGLVRSDIMWVSFVADALRKLEEAAAALSAISQRRPTDEEREPVDVDAILEAGSSANAFDQSSSVRFIDPPEIGSIVDIELTCLHSCVKFPVVFPCGTLDYRKLKDNSALKTQSLEVIRASKNLDRQINDLRFIERLPKFKDTNPPSGGDYCLAMFSGDHKFYRAQIIESYSKEDTYHVKYVDFGNKEYVHLNDMRPITEELLRVPIVSLECHLANVRPTERASLQENVKSLKIKINEIVQRFSKDPLLMVTLRATEVDGSHTNINEFVVEQGWAVNAN